MKKTLNRIWFGLDFLHKRKSVTAFPIDVNIELTNLCNLSCEMCPRTNDVSRQTGFMDFHTFKKIIDGCSAYSEFAILNGAGEPLLHPELIPFIEYASKTGMRTLISTNAILLEEKRRSALLDSSLSYLFLNINAEKRDTYQAVMGKDYFHLVTQNVEKLLAEKKQKKRGPVIIAQLIPMEKNSSEIKAFENHWKQLGVDGVSFKPFRNFGGLIPELGLNPSGKLRRPCYLLWKELTFYYDGTASACCLDFREKLVLGNILESSFLEIWNHPKLKKLRDDHIQGKQESWTLCRNCNQPPVSTPTLAGISLMSSNFRKRLIPLLYKLGYP